MLGATMRHGLKNNKSLIYLYDPFTMIISGGSGMFTASFSEKAKPQVIYLSPKDLSQVELKPKTALHEYSHLQRFYEWQNWLESGSGVFKLDSASIKVKSLGSEDFDSFYLHSRGFLSLDESRALKVSRRVSFDNLLYELNRSPEDLSKSSVHESYKEYYESLASGRNVNYDLQGILVKMADIIQDPVSSANLWIEFEDGQTIFVMNFKYGYEQSVVEVMIPLKWDDNDYELGQFLEYLENRNNFGDVGLIPRSIRYELLDSVHKQADESNQELDHIDKVMGLLGHYQDEISISNVQGMVNQIQGLATP
jgi:hypothetical protein